MSEFIADMAAVLAACGKVPALPATTALLGALVALPNHQSSETPSGLTLVQLVVGLLVALFLVGFPGTQRVWFRRAFEGSSLSAREVWNITWVCFGRFFALGLLAAVPALLVAGLVVAVGGLALLTDPGPAYYLLLSSIAIVLDVLGTFISPALTFSTRRVSEAIGIGLRTLRETWPSCILYALCPPLALQALVVLTPVGPALLVVVLAALTALVSLVFKGATAAFYLRRLPQEPGTGEWAS